MTTGLALAMLAGPALLSGPASAQTGDVFPSRPIRMTVPFPAGQGSDIAARTLVEQMNRTLPQPIVVENRPGADANVGTTAVARSKPDGYTLVMGTNASHAANAAIGNLPYDPVRDFDAVGLYYGGSMVLLARPDSPVQNLQQFVALARERPGKIDIGVPSTSARVMSSMIKDGFGIDVGIVPYKGTAGALTDLLGGHVPFVVESMSATVPRIRSGELKAIVSAARVRSRLLPELPTLDESGLKGEYISTWTAIFAPKGTPPAAINVLNTAMNDALRSPKVQEFLTKVGNDTLIATPAEAAAHVQSEVARWAAIVKKYNVKGN